MDDNKQTPIYRLSGLTKNYGTRDILEIDELNIYKGEVFALVGPSGAGKSTLLRLLNFLEFPNTGSIEFGGVYFSPWSGNASRLTPASHHGIPAPHVVRSQCPG
jgi:ABC-type Fe3+/spermidine/putrescine transport system ATPase subunit